jgi:hypothetical protein
LRKTYGTAGRPRASREAVGIQYVHVIDLRLDDVVIVLDQYVCSTMLQRMRGCVAKVLHLAYAVL